MGSDKVSVVIPAYNEADYLRKALESALNQTYSNLEIVVVDDGSTDDTASLLVEYTRRDSRVNYLRQENDNTFGLGARNWGMLNASGKWIALLDQDDIWYPQKVEKQLETLAFDRQVGCVFSPVDFINEKGVRIGTQTDASLVEYNYNDLVLKNYIYVSSGMFSRHLLARAGLPNESSGYADWWLWLSIAKHTKILKLDQVLSAYRIQADSYQQKQLRQDLHKFAQDNLLTTLSQQTRVVKFPQFMRCYEAAMNQRSKLYLRASYRSLAFSSLRGFVSGALNAVRFSRGGFLIKIKFSLRALIEGPIKAFVLKVGLKRGGGT